MNRDIIFIGIDILIPTSVPSDELTYLINSFKFISEDKKTIFNYYGIDIFKKLQYAYSFTKCICKNNHTKYLISKQNIDKEEWLSIIKDFKKCWCNSNYKYSLSKKYSNNLFKIYYYNEDEMKTKMKYFNIKIKNIEKNYYNKSELLIKKNN